MVYYDYSDETSVSITGNLSKSWTSINWCRSSLCHDVVACTCYQGHLLREI